MEIDKFAQIIKEGYGLSGDWKQLVGYDDLNLKLKSDRGNYIVKIAESGSNNGLVKDQCRILEFLESNLPDAPFPRVTKSNSGDNFLTTQIDGNNFLIRIYSWLEGELLCNSNPSAELYQDLGSLLAKLDKTLFDFKGEASSIFKRVYYWDLQYARLSRPMVKYVSDPSIRRVIEYFYQQYELVVLPEIPCLRKGLIHSDANDYNVLISDTKISGLIDFGDMVYSSIINELAIAVAYAILEKDDPVKWALEVVKGYNSVLELEDIEIDILHILVGTRLAVSLSRSAMNRSKKPEDDYLIISERPATEVIQKWIQINPLDFKSKVRKTLGRKVLKPPSIQLDLSSRLKHISPSLSISYSSPIKMGKAAFQYMFGQDGRTYLDCVNNICHVGHTHPRVVEAASRQLANLNTNTRYLYNSLNDYAETLTSKFPDPLDTVFFVNSGSEAGDLAQRIARMVTGEKNTLVVEHGYHGNTLAGIEVSHYKYEGKGGSGKSDHIFALDIPDCYRGKYKYEDPDAGQKYASQADQVIEEIKSHNQGIAAFYCESIIGCGGQVVLPPAYLSNVYKKVRDAGGLCIVDEVQVGFGRVGETFWGFELQEVIPDIVVLGKPMGNGHPLAAVVTSSEIAKQFNNGMEYFSSFGGNPVSCTIGLEVLKIIEEEELQEHARVTGQYFKESLNSMAGSHELIGDVRGYGLFLGVELVLNRATLEPATGIANRLVEEMKNRNILLSTDGPFNNVLKIKPPMVFNKPNVDRVVSTLDDVLNQIGV